MIVPVRPRHDLIDVSHAVEHGMITYRGLPAPILCDFLGREQSRAQYAHGTEFLISRIDMVGNTGTYLDSPFHRFARGADLSELPLCRIADLQAVVVRAPHASSRRIVPTFFTGLELRDKAVLIDTGWDAHWRTDRYFEGHPYLTGEAADLLVDSGASLVGIDSLNIDDTADSRRPVHSTLLGAGVPIVEHLCGLGRLPDSGLRFFAVPVKVKGCGSFPVRAFAIIERP